MCSRPKGELEGFLGEETVTLHPEIPSEAKETRPRNTMCRGVGYGGSLASLGSEIGWNPLGQGREQQ